MFEILAGPSDQEAMPNGIRNVRYINPGNEKPQIANRQRRPNLTGAGQQFT